ncbi:hypothetical protein PybrP1_011540 [[Pythium] brassicae (nom. inval.)]|nr:hypothetical protein PybrP1_011540 [[Pythium] brassicae (nom. inval.)]
MNKIPIVKTQLARAKTSATRRTSPVSGAKDVYAAAAIPVGSSTPPPLSSGALARLQQRKKSVDEQNEDTDATEPLAEQVEKFRPELLPLLPPAGLPEQQHHWQLDDVADAVKLSHLLQDRLLCLPELNRNSPCYSARSIVLLFTKLKYLETFPALQIAEYAARGDAEYDEVRVLHQLKSAASTAERISRLAALLHVPSHGEAWHEIAKFVACALPFAEQTETLLLRGSDERSVLCPVSKTNKYSGSTVPSSSRARCVARASCTCSSISASGFQRCEKLRQELLLNSLSINPNSQSASAFFDSKMSAVRARVAVALGVADLVADDALRIVLTPSGTDAELLATSAALARAFSQQLAGGGHTNTTRRVTSIISAQGEIGRGSASASGGRHFSELTPSGEPAVPGEPLRRYPSELVEVIELAARDDAGALRCTDALVAATVHALLADPRGSNVVLLHVVMGAKTGFRAPSLAVADALANAYPTRLLVVVDACQMRLSLRAFRGFAQRGYVTLVTGSKFFGGAPFCGAVLLPMRCVYELESAAGEPESAELCAPLGLEDYFSRYDFPAAGLRQLRARMGAFLNVGLLLRWESALATLEPYARIPERDVAAIAAAYVARTKRTLASPKWRALVEVLADDEVDDEIAGAPISNARSVASDGDDASSSASACDASSHRPCELGLEEHGASGELPGLSTTAPMDSIVSFKVFDERRQAFLDAARLRDLHALLAKDLSPVLPDDADAKARCLLGQPVQLGKQRGAVLRLALGADMVNAVFYRALPEGSRAAVDEFAQEDEIVLRKMALILRHWELLHQRFIEERVVAPPLEMPKPLRDWNFAVKKTQLARVVRKMCDDGIVGAAHQQPRRPARVDDKDGDAQKLALVYDLDAIDMAFQALLTSFPPHFEHRFAMKSCPLAFFIRRAIENDVGLECASIVEVQHALRLGCAPAKIVFDSPCKTRRDIAFAINAGVEVNADNFDELQIIREHAEELFQSNFPECTPRFAGHLPRIGLRVNPLLGAGSNEVLSVSTMHSKFGVPLTPANRARIVAFFRENPWMSGLHCHVGSQGCTLEMLAHGASVISELANEIDAAAGVSRVKVLNIGGGLPSNYDSDDVAPTFAEYVDVLRKCAPHLFERNGRTVLTEFGRSVSAKTGWTISEVEYVKQHEPAGGSASTEPSLSQTAIIHAGSDLFLRTCYVPALFPHRLSVYTADGIESTAPLAKQNIAGPLCFGGDIIGRGVELPTIARGDFVVIHDVGSNTISLFSRHCSRPAPAVYGYRSTGDDISIALLKPAESPEDVMRFWG